jgi:NADH-quinone oxidoreductase subunit L
MIGLVLSTNILQIYIFWELVGLSSYLLIGFYFQNPSAVAASKKAFIVTRFADLGFLIGILIVGYYAETLDFSLAIERLTSSSPQFLRITGATFMGVSLLTWALTLIFIGGAGKSAMFPLHVWLPDAMEGPTPVSALIHAATMVVAGVYLVARLFPVFAAASPAALQVVLYTGLLSSLLAAGIACTQTDIKRVLAYSTMSQIGFMMFALGVSKYGGEGGLGFSASMFHLFTHAFFKSLLFLCAGAIIHQVHSNEMKNMGGLRKLMPVTHIAFLIACLSISAIPPFSGFFSKEEILLAVKRYSLPMFAMVLLISAFTAFYMFRLYFSIFWRGGAHEHNDNPAGAHHSVPHSSEGPVTMRIPIIILAVASLLAGFVPFGRLVTSDGNPLVQHFDFVFSIVPVAFSLIGITFAARLYLKNNDKAERLAASYGVLYRAALKKFYIDEIYIFITKKVIFNLFGKPAAWIDKYLVDGTVNGMAKITAGVSENVKGLQSGKIQNYALVFFGGIAALTILVIYIWK